jgi:glycosyltransferase involved in cell wall biosynthesis
VISVLLPYRDASATLREAIDSILEERDAPLELLAIDDGSTDAGPAIVASLAARDARIVPLTAGGVGIPGALARGLTAARGAFIARMDADDISLPGRLSRSRAALEADARLGAVGTQVEAFADTGTAVGEGMRRYVDWMNALVSPEDHARDLFVESPLCHPSVTLRREALLAVGGYRDVPWAEDYDLWLRLAARGYGLAKVPDVLLRWRHREERATLTDPRYALPRFDEAKGHYLAPRLTALGKPIAMWGAGKTGKRIARALERHGVYAERFIDIDPRKIGRLARGAPIVTPDALARGRHTVVVAVGAPGARAIVRGRLDAAGFVEGADYLCAS